MIRRSLLAEALGSLILFATVIGSGIMAERLAGGNVAVALLGNTLATGAILFVLITIPQARFVDRLVEEDQRRTRGG